ncbi:hypothetical protein [Campylobacter concisus]|jgi:hypothetical protein
MIILLQGNISSYTLDTYFYYCENLGESNVYISCWSDDFDSLEDNRKYEIKKQNLVLSKKPNHSGRYNVNYQCCSTLNGIRHIASIIDNDLFVIKTRTDQRVDIDCLKISFNDFLKASKKFFAIDLFTRRYVPFHLGDMLIGMKVKDHLLYWDYFDLRSHDQYEFWKNELSRLDLKSKFFNDTYACAIPEVAILFNYLKKTRNVKFDVNEWVDFFNDNVFLAQSSRIKLRSYKFGNQLINTKSQINANFFSPKNTLASTLIIGCVKENEYIKKIKLQKLIVLNFTLYIFDFCRAIFVLFGFIGKNALFKLYNIVIGLIKKGI